MTTQAPEQPSRYTRSFGGMIGAMLVTLVLVGVYVGFRALGREQPDGRPDAVAYIPSVRALQEADVTVIYPAKLPRDWVSTSVDYDPGQQQPQWTVGIVTAGNDFVGLAQQDAPLDDLLHGFVDDHPTQGRDATVPSPLGDTWQTWSDSGGDHALSIKPSSGPLVGQRVLVYGSASLSEQEKLIALLSTSTLPPRTSPTTS